MQFQSKKTGAFIDKPNLKTMKQNYLLLCLLLLEGMVAEILQTIHKY